MFIINIFLYLFMDHFLEYIHCYFKLLFWLFPEFTQGFELHLECIHC